MAKNTANEYGFKVGMMVKTVGGNDAKICCFSRGKMLVHVYSHAGSYMDRDIKYNMDGTSPWATNLNKLRLVVPTAA